MAVTEDEVETLVGFPVAVPVFVSTWAMAPPPPVVGVGEEVELGVGEDVDVGPGGGLGVAVGGMVGEGDGVAVTVIWGVGVVEESPFSGSGALGLET